MYLVPARLPNGELVIKLDNFTIRGKSTGGKETALIIEELSVIFDVGFQADKLETIQNITISHSHMDHFGCLHFCHGSKKLQNITTPYQIIMPQNCLEPFKAISTAVSSLGRGGFPIEFQNCTFEDGKEQKVIRPFEHLRADNVVMAEDCKEIFLMNKNNFVIDAYKMNHKITSFGYVISEKRPKLKKQYHGLSGAEIKTLKDSGVDVSEQIKIPTIAFTGDTQIDAILKNDEFLNVSILIMESTHFDYDPSDPDCAIQDAIDHGHVHFKQFVDNISKFKNKYIVLCHFSQKYRKLADIEEHFKLLTPEEQRRIVVWIT